MMLLNVVLTSAKTFIEGTPLSYMTQKDDVLALLLLGCFFLSTHVLSHSRKFLLLLGKEFFQSRERNSIFANTSSVEMRYVLLLILQTFVLVGVCLFNCLVQDRPSLIHQVDPHALLGFCVASCLLYFALKWLLYLALGWIFFDKQQVGNWLESYSTLLYYLGFSLFPITLLIVYFGLNLQFALVLGVFIFILVKILMLYKYIKLFCDKLYGCFLLILYFCALEIIPALLMCKGLSQLIEYLIIKI